MKIIQTKPGVYRALESGDKRRVYKTEMREIKPGIFRAIIAEVKS